MLKLRKLEIPTFVFRREFTKELDGLSDGDGRTFIEIRGRAGGDQNPELSAGTEEISIRAVVLDKQRDIILKKAATNKDAAERAVNQAVANNREIAKLQVGLYYDACVIDWETNILDEDCNALKFDRETYIALSDVKIDQIGDAFIEFMKRVGEVAKSVADHDEDVEKN